LSNSYVSRTCHGELRPTSGCDLLASLGHPCKFQRVSRVGSVTSRHSSSGRQPNFAALNRGRHLYSAGRPSPWALVHIYSCIFRATPLCYRGLGSRPSVHPSVRPSVCPSVRLSHACFVSNSKNLPAIFLYHMKGQSL